MMSIQTIIASKRSGCESTAGHYGLALFVNEWQTNDGALFLSWGNRVSGCEELSTPSGTVSFGKWHFISANFDARGDASLYVDGQMLAHSRLGLGKAKIKGGASPISREVPLMDKGRQVRLRVGAHPDDTYAMRGAIAELTLWSRALSDAEIVLAMWASTDKSRGGGRGGGALNATLPSTLAELSFASAGPALAAHGADGAAVTINRGLSRYMPAVQRLEPGAPPIEPRAADRWTGSTSQSAPEFRPTEGWPLPWLAPWSRPNISVEALEASDALSRTRREYVRSCFKRTWSAYRKYAWGKDELRPISNTSHDWLKLAATMIDSLDNLWIFGMKREFAEAQAFVSRMTFNHATGISMFETVIRIVGGLLSAFELSKERVFLAKAKECADLMMYAFEHNHRGLPCSTVSLDGRKVCSMPMWAGHAVVLSEFGTIQLEFKYLAHHTGERKYWDAAERIMEHLQTVDKPQHLFPIFMNPNSGKWTSQKVSFGALGDSFYEYLIKQWLITNKKVPYLRELFDETMLGMARLLVQRSSPSGLIYIAEWSYAGVFHKMDHLACFAGAMLAIGAQDGGKYDAQYMALADGIGHTCYEMYASTKTGLASEMVFFVPGHDMVQGRATFNIGRPEAVETLYVLWYYTRDPKWRDMAWDIFSSFERYVGTPSGWAALPNVDQTNRRLEDKMESFVLAETMKYLFLIFDNDETITLDKYVFNTEAHPLGRFDPM